MLENIAPVLVLFQKFECPVFHGINARQENVNIFMSSKYRIVATDETT